MLTTPPNEASDARSDGRASVISNLALGEDDVLLKSFQELDISQNDRVNSGHLLKVFENVGLTLHDPRLKTMFERLEEIGALRKDVELTFDQFTSCLEGSIVLFTKCIRGALIVRDWGDFVADVTEIHEEVAKNESGDVATYIPQLGNQDPNLFEISVCTIDGQILNIGNCKGYKSCVQSCCKPIAYLMAVQERGFDYVHNHVGREPSGASFNNLALKDFPDEQNPKRKIPHNPMINSGAIMSCSIIKKGRPMAERFDHVMNTWNRICGSPAGFSNTVYLSEKDTADRNWCLGYMMQEYKAFPEGTDLDDTLQFYFQQCSIEATNEQMSILAGTLANGGMNPLTGDAIFDPFHVRNCLSLMLSSGMYDYSGEWCFSVGLPAKSGVAGFIWCVVPNKMGIAVFSPSLDEHGNSSRGVHVFSELVKKFNFHQYDLLRGVLSRGKHVKKDPTLGKSELNVNQLTSLLFACAEGDLSEVKRLRAEGVDLWAGDYDQRTCLHLAASEGHWSVVRFLVRMSKIDNESDLNPEDRWGNTPLDDAIRGEHTKIANLLKKAGGCRSPIREH